MECPECGSKNIRENTMGEIQCYHCGYNETGDLGDEEDKAYEAARDQEDRNNN